MFDKKQSTLITKKSKESKASTTGKVSVKGATQKGNSFLAAGLGKSPVQKVVRSGNGAKKFSSTANVFVDQFGQAGNYKKPRTFPEITKSMVETTKYNFGLAMRLLFYLRLITRAVVLPNGQKTTAVQRGQGLKHEGIFRMMWFAINKPDMFWKNIALYISVGSWKDIFTMLSYDLQYNGWNNRKLDWDSFGSLILAGLENEGSVNLVKKYMPQIKSNSRCKTLESQADNIIAKWLCYLLFGNKRQYTDDQFINNDGKFAATYKQYRLLKTSGNAHEWQKLISQRKLLKIDFSTIHGRALAQLVSSKFLKNNNLTSVYSKWLEKQPAVKYTGYPYELLTTIPSTKDAVKENTIIKQFKTLVDTAKKGIKTDTSLIVVRDTSSSMGSPAVGTKISCYNIAKSLALFFSEMLPDGHFANSWIEFHSTATMRQWNGNNVVEKWRNDRSGYVGGTNFQSVIDLFVKIKRQGIAEKEFPTGILCISDGEFNPAQLGKTNVQAALDKLKAAGFSKKYVDNFQIILWNVGNNYYGRTSGNKFETSADTKNVFYFSGLDGSVVSFLTGMQESAKSAPKTPEELFDAAMDQEVLNLIQE